MENIFHPSQQFYPRKIGYRLDLRTSHYNGNEEVRGPDIVRRSCQSRNRHSLRDLGRSRHLLLHGSAFISRRQTHSGLPVVPKSAAALLFGSSCVAALPASAPLSHGEAHVLGTDQTRHYQTKLHQTQTNGCQTKAYGSSCLHLRGQRQA